MFQMVIARTLTKDATKFVLTLFKGNTISL